jgi:hypothetical protein
VHPAATTNLAKTQKYLSTIDQPAIPSTSSLEMQARRACACPSRGHVASSSQ